MCEFPCISGRRRDKKSDLEFGPVIGKQREGLFERPLEFTGYFDSRKTRHRRTFGHSTGGHPTPKDQTYDSTRDSRTRTDSLLD